jgi:ribosomal protein S18 acetylase RimI-like enzyme
VIHAAQRTRAGSIHAVNDEFARALAFLRLLQERTSTRVEPFRWGTALFNDDIPERHYSNFVRVEEPLTGVEVAELLDETDRALLGLPHRLIGVEDDADGERVAMGLAASGYAGDHSVLLALRREPDRPGEPDTVVEVAFDEARPFEVEVYRRMLADQDPAVIEKFADHRRIVQRAVNGRFFAQRIDGQIAGMCELYLVDGLAQVEHVDTLEEFRGRGVARNLVLRALAEARAASADLTIIEADVNDWPVELYRRLGFDEIGRTWAFLRAPGP